VIIGEVEATVFMTALRRGTGRKAIHENDGANQQSSCCCSLLNIQGTALSSPWLG